jgi:hypothetical protein
VICVMLGQSSEQLCAETKTIIRTDALVKEMKTDLSDWSRDFDCAGHDVRNVILCSCLLERMPHISGRLITHRHHVSQFWNEETMCSD